MQESPKNHKKIYYRLRRSDPHERLGATLRHFSFGAAVFFVVAAAAIVIHSLYDIQIRDGAQYRQYAAQQQLLDSTIQATRGEIYDTSGHHAGIHQRGMDHLGRPQLQQRLSSPARRTTTPRW